MADPQTLSALYDRVLHLKNIALDAEHDLAATIENVADHHRESARNLIHYVAVRGHDLRPLQEELTAAGVSSLGRMEAGVLGHLEAVLELLAAAAHREHEASAPDEVLTPAEGREILETRATQVLGEQPENRFPRIMVTMPEDAGDDPELVAAMTEAGMDLARVNAAHDTPEVWSRMIDNIRATTRSTGEPPKVTMDLAGPKLRTGPMTPGPQVLKVRPARNVLGQVTAPSRVWFSSGADDKAPADTDAVIPLAGDPEEIREVLDTLLAGDECRFSDARGYTRTLTVTAVHEGPESGPAELGVQIEARRTIYWQTGAEINFGRDGILTVGELPAKEPFMRVHTGEEIILVNDLEPRSPVDEPPYIIGCSAAQAFEDVKVGDRVLIDDGKITTEVTDHSADQIHLRITQAPPGGTKLKSEKGVNFPDTDLHMPALTDEDRSHIPFVVAHADGVNMSFVRSTEDVADLLDTLEAASKQLHEEGTTAHSSQISVVLKIETVASFKALPQMLLEAMRWDSIGVMIARGDLAVEAGFERMAELQEEMMWLCEAGHVPVIWATQVLESLAKDGLPSRAEITDAAMSQRAESVMLNKGPFIVETIGALSNILNRMEGHAQKKQDMLRKLESWDLSFSPAD